MAKANPSNRLKKELENKLEGVFAQLKRGQEYLDHSLSLTPYRKRWRLNAELLIEGSDDDKGGRGVNASWKTYTGQHAGRLLDALLEVIKQFCAGHQDQLAAGTKVALRYHNFGVRRQRIRTI